MKQQIMAKNLAKGDLIVVPYSNYLHPAIFYGYGSSGNFQFLLLNSYRTNNLEGVEKRLASGKKPYIDFINRWQENCIARIYEQDLTPELLEKYHKLYDLLSKYKILTNRTINYETY